MNRDLKKIIFFGSDDFAEVHLRALLASDHKVAACVTQPDRPKDRGMKLTMSSIKECALESSIPVLQPERLKNNEEIVQQLKNFGADIFVVIAYGRFLTPEILAIPKIGSVNVHGSLLPKYRGAAPINWAIINGELETGLTIMKLNAQMDAGAILIQEKIGIASLDTAITVRQKMMEIGPSLLIKALDVFSSEATGLAQAEAAVTFAPKLTKDLGVIDWNKSAEQIHNLVRGLQPWPTAYSKLGERVFSILKTEVSLSVKYDVAPGTVVECIKEDVLVSTGYGILIVKEVQPAGSKRMSLAAFLRGQRKQLPVVLGH